MSKLPRSITLIGAIAVLASCSTTTTPTASGGGATQAATMTQPERVAKVEKSTVQILGKEGDNTVGGTGEVVDASKGLVLTNAHVVTGLSSLKVRFNDGTSSPARIVAKAPCDDLAVVEIVNKPTGLVALTLGDSSKVQPGQHVTAVGYPASFQDLTNEKPTATEGSASAVDIAAEPDASLPKYTSLIQHQAPINPGNSGGPLVDDAANLIGINTLGNTLQGGRAIQGQYYAITVNHVKQLLSGLEAGKSRDDIGVAFLPNSASLSDEFDTQFHTPLPTTDGLLVLAVDSGGAGDDQHLAFGDVITSIEDTTVSSVADVCDILESHSSGNKLRFHGQSTFGTPPKFFADVIIP